ncbi:MAG: hypothetical protein WDN07_04780 [Actinomycetota bacterium]
MLAKVYRDRIMIEMDSQYPVYGFAQHKGYVTTVHSAALKNFGVSAIHRKSFSNVATLL